MNDKVLTDDEKSALLDGVSSGAVEVHSSDGPKYADVKPFELPKRSVIRTNSFPRLQLLNQQLAERLARYTESNLHCEVRIGASGIRSQAFAECIARDAGEPAVCTFTAEPLDGQAVIFVDPDAIGQLVEGFFGGSNNGPAGRRGTTLTAGELSVCRLFCNAVLSTVQEVWEPVIELVPEIVSLDVGTEIVTAIADTDTVLATHFDIEFPQGRGSFGIHWPQSMVASLMPVFDGQKRERDAAEDARWQRVIRARLPDANISLSGTVGHARLPLKNLTQLKPGDVIDIDSPRSATLYAKDVAVLRGMFGVLAGRNAIEANGWIAGGGAN
ncbi:MAG: FliM/FliN family flagellar motor switch protein [Woeseiaceae bacterium]